MHCAVGPAVQDEWVRRRKKRRKIGGEEDEWVRRRKKRRKIGGEEDEWVRRRKKRVMNWWGGRGRMSKEEELEVVTTS